jgi:TP901 family phage tail tape measure protein
MAKPVLISIASEFDSKGIAEAQKQLAALQKNLPTNKFEEMGARFQAVGKKMQNVGKSLTLAVTLPIVGLGAAAIAASVSFESAFAGVRKTVEATEEEFAGLERGIRDMALRLPASAESIAAVAEAAGQLGIKTPAILGFTETMINLGEATNLSATDAATALARLANITQLPQDQFSNLGSTIVALGNNLATTESEITEMGLRIAGAGKQVGLTQAEILGLAGALSSVGIEAAAGGSSISRVFLGIQTSVFEGGKRLEAFAKIAGVSADDFAKKFKEAPAEAFVSFVGGLQRIQEEGGNVVGALTDVGFSELRVRDSLLRAAGAGDLLATSLGIATTAFSENTALSEEAEKRYATTAAQLQILKNQFKEMALTIGQVLVPFLMAAIEAFKPLLERMQELAQSFSNLSPNMQKTIVTIIAVVAAIGPLLLIGGKLVSLIGSLIIFLPKLGIAFTLATGPIGLIIAAVAALVAGIVILYKNNEDFRNFVHQVWSEISNFIGTAIGSVKQFLDDNRESIDKLRQAFSTIALFLSTYVGPILETLIKVQLKVMIEVIKAVISGVSLMIQIFLKFASAAIQVVAAIANFVASVTSGMSRAASAVTDFGTKVKNSFANAITMLYNVGRDIVMGLWNGLQSMSNFLITNVTNWIKSVLPDPIERFLGISSPSKLFARIGVNVAEGLIQGLDEKKDAVTQKSQELLNNALGKVNEAIDRARQFGQSIADSLFKGVDLSAATTTAKETGVSIVDAIVQQSQRVAEFGRKTQELLRAGLNRTTYEQIIALGAERGIEVADAYLKGNTSELVRRTNDAVNAARGVADSIGREAAKTFERTGIKNALDLLEGLIMELMPAGKKRRQLMQVMDDLARSLNRKSTIVVETVYTGGGGGGGGGGAPAPDFSNLFPSGSASYVPIDLGDLSAIFPPGSLPFFANGGIVTGPTLGVVGEAGPEAIIPLSRAGNMMGGSVYNIVVNPGLSTDAETGRAVVEAIKRYERTSGQIFANA